MLVHPNFDPVAFSLGPVSVHWYGLMYLFAFIQFIVLGKYTLRYPHVAQRGWTKEKIDDMLFYAILGVVIGGRLGEVMFYNPSYYFSNPIEIVFINKGGMSFHGGFLGALVAMWLWARQFKMPLSYVYDFVAPMVPLGYAAGRIGNFINHELPGRAANPDSPFAMMWPNIAYPVHPSPLYQASVDGVLVFFIVWYFAFWSKKASQRLPLAVGALYVMLYGLARFMTEFFRVPDYEVHFFGITLSAGQMLSTPMIAIGALLLYGAYQGKFTPQNTPPQTPQAPQAPAVSPKKKKTK